MCLGFCGDEAKSESDDALYPVNYEARYPELDFSNIWHVEGLAKILFTKDQSWGYEKEWRKLIVDGDQLQEYTGRLSKIIFGLRTQESEKELVRSILSNHEEVSFFRVVQDASRYQLNIEEDAI